MSKHVRDSKRLTRQTIVSLHEKIREIQEFENGPVCQAMHMVERSRQGGWGDKGIKAKPTRDRKTDTTAKADFKRLVLQPAGCDSFDEWIALSPVQLKKRLLTDRDWQHVNAVAHALTVIFAWRKDVALRSAIAWKYGWGLLKTWDSWKKVKRGRDLFLPGMGKFEVNRLEICQFMEHSKQPPYSLRHPVEIGLIGSFETLLDKQPTKMGIDVSDYVDYLTRIWLGYPEYVVRWRVEILQTLHTGELDELVKGLRLDPFHYEYLDPIVPNRELFEMRPERVIDRLRALEAVRYDRQQVADDHSYNIKAPLRSTTLGAIAPIQTYGELKEVGQKLRNCAATYHEQIESNESTLFALKTHDGKPLALGEWDGHDFVQLLGPCNQPVAQEVRYEFDRLAINLRH